MIKSKFEHVVFLSSVAFVFAVAVIAVIATLSGECYASIVTLTTSGGQAHYKYAYVHSERFSCFQVTLVYPGQEIVCTDRSLIIGLSDDLDIDPPRDCKWVVRANNDDCAINIDKK